MQKQACLAFLTALIALGQDAWSERMNLANRLQQQGRYVEAGELYRKAVTETEDTDSSSLRHAQAMNNLAAHYFELGRYSDAEPLYRRAIESWTKLGETGRLGISYSNLATLHRKTGRYSLAIAAFDQAGKHILNAFGPESGEYVNYLVNLSEAQRVSGRLDESEATAAKALTLSEKIFQAGDPRLSHTLHAYAVALQGRGITREAASLLERALKIRELAYGADHPFVAATLTGLVSLYLEQAQYNQAEPLAQRALGIWEAKLGAEHPNTAVALNNLAQAYRFQQRFSEAEPLYRRASEILEKLGTPEATKPLANLAEFYLERGRHVAALGLYHRCEAIARRAFGEAAPQTTALQLKIAQVYHAMGRDTEAARLYKRVNQTRAGQAFLPVR